MKVHMTHVVVTLCLSLLGVSLAACTDQHHKKSKRGAVPVIVGKVQKVQEQETLSVSGTVSTPNTPAQGCLLVPNEDMSAGCKER